MIHIEVKSGSYIQDWDQKDYSRIVFSRLRGLAVALDGSGISEELNESPGKRLTNHMSLFYVSRSTGTKIPSISLILINGISSYYQESR